MPHIILIAHNLRSCHHVGSLLRTAEGLGVKKVWLTGYTPYPQAMHDTRLPHLAAKIERQIYKTALGAEKTQNWEHSTSIEDGITQLKQNGYTIVAIEQAAQSIPLPEFTSPDKVALVVGREVEGVEPEVLVLCDQIVEIPMFGKKESFNVVQASAMALYQTTFTLRKA